MKKSFITSGPNLSVFISVRCMMFGFGDDKNPYTESVDLLEDMVVEYISEMVSMVDVPKFQNTKCLPKMPRKTVQTQHCKSKKYEP